MHGNPWMKGIGLVGKDAKSIFNFIQNETSTPC